MKRISWVRPIKWCAKHDFAWATHSEWGIFIDPDCDQSEHWVEDVEKVRKLGLPRCDSEST